MNRIASPVEKLHRLIALARLTTRRNDDMTERVAEAMLNIPRQIRARGWKIDRNWTPRLSELFLALEHRDSLLPSRLVANPTFGDVADLVWTEQMDPENLERARHKCLMQSRKTPIQPEVARFVALGPDAVPRNFVSKWLEQPSTRSAAWLAIASHAKTSDIDELTQAALSTDKTVREAATKALQRLGQKMPRRESNSASIQNWLALTEQIALMTGDSERGRQLYVDRQCVTCHNGGKALGPSLEGISKRFGTADLFRATVDPSHTISDRYRARIVLTQSGEVVMGMVVYESVDGVTLQTSDGKTHRINSDEITESRESAISIMPEGLLRGFSQEDVADLLAYLRAI